jgi:CMP-N-acetylneuraminic acid synthetase
MKQEQNHEARQLNPEAGTRQTGNHMNNADQTMNILTIIPARAGSKRIPDKNLVDFCGRPLIEHTIGQALRAGMEFVVVSTDSQRIAEMAKKAGARCDFIRPGELASDTATTIDVIIHALGFYRARGLDFKAVLVLQPTSPLRDPADIEASLRLFKLKGAESVVSVCEVDHPSAWSAHLDQDLGMHEFYEKLRLNIRSQDLPKEYRLNGSIYVVRTETLLRDRTVLSSNASFAYIMDRSRSVDIDTTEDLDYARYLKGRTAEG